VTVRRTDIHQHLWPDALLSSLARRTAAPRLRRDGRRWRLEVAGDAPAPFDPSAHDVGLRASLASADGLQRVIVAPSHPLGIEWLPDGAIQSAWLRLKQGSLEANRGEVKKDLFQAFDRGIPYYSLGLQWLADGLTLLAVDDEEAANRLKMVQRVSFSADVSSLFTALNLRPY